MARLFFEKIRKQLTTSTNNMKLNQAKFSRKNRRNISKNNKRMLENADILSGGNVTARLEWERKTAEWHKKIRANSAEWIENLRKL